ncbi:MAG: hypothetical protein KDA37_14510 [Planctomycetales bacterium]|nr:hypothetical protein [Planctomycetales bacterium]
MEAKLELSDPDGQVTCHRGAVPQVRAKWFGFWDLLGVMLGIAGAAYPLVLLVLFWVIGACYLVGKLMTGEIEAIGEAALGVGISAILALMLAGVCLLYSGMVSVVVLPLSAGACRLLVGRPRLPYLGAFCGGLVAFVCFLPYVVLGDAWDNALLEWTLAYYAAGPMLAILCGLIAGAYAGVEFERELQVLGKPIGASPVKFSIKQMLAVTLIASLLLTVLRLTGLLNARMLTYVTFWLVWQSLAMYPVVWLMRLRRRRVERRLAEKLRRIRAAYGDLAPDLAEPPATTGAT